MAKTGTNANALRENGVAAEALTGGRFVVRGATGIEMADSAGEAVNGAVDLDWDSGKAMSFVAQGEVSMLAGGAFDAGDLVTTDANGSPIIADTEAQVYAGQAVDTASGAGVYVRIYVNPSLSAVPGA